MENGNTNEVKGCLIERKGRYYALIYYYVEGERISETKATGISVKEHKKREAEKIKDNLIAQIQAQLDKEQKMSQMHLFADCLERWVKHKAKEVESTTAASYVNKVKTPIEYFREKSTLLETLQPKDILSYYEWALKHGRRRTYRKDAPTSLKRCTVKDQAGLIKSFLDDAVLQGIIPVNPASAVSVPKTKEDNVKEIAFMDLEQAKQFLHFIKTNPSFYRLYVMSKIGLYYGLRRSEILGLKWDAIDFEKKEIEICHTVVRISNKPEHRDNVKTPNSHRYLPLLDEVRTCLLDLIEKQKELKIYSEKGYVFLWEDGREYDPDYISKLFKKAVKACPYDIPESLTFHGLRHSCCAILFEKGWDIAEVQQWLGHGDIQTTANIYNHAGKKWKNKHGKKIDGLFG